MKKIITLGFMACAMILLTAYAPKTSEAIAYNDQIIDQQVKIIDKINLLYKTLEDWTDHLRMDQAYTEACIQVETGTAELEKMPGFDGSTEFRDAALILFDVYKSVLENEFKEMIQINKLPDDEFTTEQKNKYDRLNDQAFNKMNIGLDQLQVVQRKFAKKYKFRIEKSNKKK